MKKQLTTSMVLTALACAVPAFAQEPAITPAPEAQQPAPPPARPIAPMNMSDMRHHIYVMEGALARAVDYGAKQLNRQILQVMPGVFMLEGEARARGVHLDSYGVFFDVRVPMMRQSMAWSLQVMLNQSDEANQRAIEDIRNYMRGITDPVTRARLEKSVQQLERSQAPYGAANQNPPMSPAGLVMPNANVVPSGAAQQAGLLGTIPMVLAEPSMDHTLLKTVGEAALGTDVSGAWNTDFDNPVNKAFVEAFTKKYGRTPTMYAAQGYDTAIAIGTALKAINGKIDNADGFRAAMLKADYKLTRGAFKFGKNQHPVQDWYAMKVEKDPSGAIVLKTREKILTDYGDPYAADCKL